MRNDEDAVAADTAGAIMAPSEPTPDAGPPGAPDPGWLDVAPGDDEIRRSLLRELVMRALL